MRVNENPPRPPAPPATPAPAAPAKPPAAGPGWPRVPGDQFAPARGGPANAPSAGMGEEPQSQYGVRLSKAQQAHQAGLDRFMARIEGQVDRLAERLKTDPQYLAAAAPGAWPRMTAEQKRAFGAHVSTLMGEELGFRPAQVKLGWDQDRQTDGSYDDETGELDINRNATVMADMGQFMNTVVHEQFHAYQNALTKGKHAADDPRHAASQVYKLDKQAYQEAPDDRKKFPALYRAYRQQPSEAHAFMVGQRFYGRMTGAE